jgi:hypothetical protein
MNLTGARGTNCSSNYCKPLWLQGEYKALIVGDEMQN